MKLRTRIFLTFSVLATIPLVIFTVFCYKRYTETTYDRIDVISSHLFENAQKTANDTLNKVRQTAGTFNFYYNDGSSIISDLKKFKDPINSSQKPVRRLLQNFFLQNVRQMPFWICVCIN